MANSQILVVENNKMNRQLCCDLLTAHRIDHIISTEGEAALKLAAQEKPGLILLNLQLPDMSGQDVLEKLKEDPLLKEIPVIVMTSPLEERRLNTLKCEGYLPKPITIESFFGSLMPFWENLQLPL